MRIEKNRKKRHLVNDVFLSADALPTNIRVPVGRTRILIPISFQILDSLRCLPFMWTFILDMLLLSFFFILHNCPLLIPLYNTAVLINICRFLINVANVCKPLSLPLISRYCILHYYIGRFHIETQSFCVLRRTVSANQCHSHGKKNGTYIRQYFYVLH